MMLDVQMTVLDGHVAIRRILDVHPELPIIGLTAHALPEARQPCLEARMVEHVVKPIDMAELVVAIRRHVDARRATRKRSVTGDSSWPNRSTPIQG